MVTTKTIEVTKASTVIDNGDGEVGKGDIIKYNITVQNTGNVNLTNITLSDTLTDGNGNILTLTSSPTYNSSSLGSSEGSLKVSETATYTASYTIAQNAVDSGSINNTLLATASSPGQTNNVTDTSDDGIDNDGNTIDDPTVVSITASPSIEVTKTSTITDNGDGTLGNGDLVKYTITVENKGNVTLSNISLTDILKDSNNVSLNLIVVRSSQDLILVQLRAV